jgi:hypothetical protein
MWWMMISVPAGIFFIVAKPAGTCSRYGLLQQRTLQKRLMGGTRTGGLNLATLNPSGEFYLYLRFKISFLSVGWFFHDGWRNQGSG